MHYLEQELRQLVKQDEQIFRFVEEGCLDGIWYWDLEKPENEWMSPKMWETLGCDPSTKRHLVSEWQDLIHPDDLATAIENFNSHCRDPNAKYDQYVRYRNGSDWTWVRCRGIAIRNKEGKPIRMLGAHVDVTEIKTLQLETAVQRRELEERNQELSVFAHAASHDLQSPVKSMLGIISLMKEDASENDHTDLEENIQHLETLALRTQRLTNALLTIGRIQNTAPMKKLGRVGSFTEKVWQEVAEEYEFDKQSLEFVGLNQELNVDHDMFELMLRNILSNCIKYRHPDRNLKIRVAWAEDQVSRRLEIEDNGCGMTLEQCKESTIFFKRFHSASDIEGSGLGLGIVRQIAKRHGASVRLEPKLPFGLKVVVCFDGEES